MNWTYLFSHYLRFFILKQSSVVGFTAAATLRSPKFAQGFVNPESRSDLVHSDIGLAVKLGLQQTSKILPIATTGLLSVVLEIPTLVSKN